MYGDDIYAHANDKNIDKGADFPFLSAQFIAMRIIFMGTPGFAACCLEMLAEAGFQITAVVTAPDKPAGRGMQLKMSEVKAMALSKGLPVLQPTKLKDPDFLKALESYHADVFVVVAFRMLPEAVWAMPSQGTINAHGSLLPQYRGAAPIQHAIMNGEKRTGVTTFIIGKDIDTGDILLREEMEIGEEENAGELHDRMQRVAGELLIKTLNAIAAGGLKPQPQSTLEAGLIWKEALKLTRENTRIDWHRSAKQIHDFCRGLDPFPGAWSLLKQADDEQPVKIFKTNSIALEEPNLSPGTIRINSAGALEVACSGGWMRIFEWQTAGKKRMKCEDWLRGFHGKIESLRLT
jgi:methionyl-tRNA formyltransferase